MFAINIGLYWVLPSLYTMEGVHTPLISWKLIFTTVRGAAGCGATLT